MALGDLRPEAPLFDLIKFRLGGHCVRVETDRWLRPEVPKCQRICRCCTTRAVEDEQHFLFDCPFHASISLVARHVHVCFQARKRLTQSDEPQLAPYPGPQRVNGKK